MIKDIVEKIEMIAKKEAENRRSILSQIELLYDDITNENLHLKFIEIRNEDVRDHIACGVDGSKYEVELEDVTIVLAKSVIVEGDYTSRRAVPKHLKEDFKILGNHYGKVNITNSSTLLMLDLETNMLEKCEECNVIFIDGPIIEPPYYNSNEIKIEGFPNFNDLVKYRAKIIKKLKNTKNIIGIVKNFYHRFLINLLVDEGYRKLMHARESYLVNNLFMKYRNENKYQGTLLLGIINWDDVKQKIKLSDLEFLLDVYLKYKNEDMSISVSSLYFQLNTISPIVRIDLIRSSSDEEIISQLNYVKVWSVSGIREVTLLTKLADEYSSITSKDAENYIKLFKLFYNSEYNKNINILKV
ncbi:MAG: DNA double-strand break repair nuclease NurA [Sulfolobaceae archaeon]